MVPDTCLWISLRLHADTWLRGDTRGCDGGIRKELAAGVRYGQTEGERAQELATAEAFLRQPTGKA